MLEIERRKFIFKTKDFWFTDPFDVKGYASVCFSACKNRAQGFECKEVATWIIDLTKDLDAIWKDFHVSCRYKINRAKREGIKVKVNEGLKEFCEINHVFRRMKGIPPPIPEYMKGTLFIAEFNGEMLGGRLYLEDEANIRLSMSASKRLEVDKKKATMIANANRLMIWETIKYAKNKGIRKYDMGGYYLGRKDEELERINYFKRSFGGELEIQYSCQKDYSMLYRLIKQIYQKKWVKG